MCKTFRQYAVIERLCSYRTRRVQARKPQTHGVVHEYTRWDGTVRPAVTAI